MFIRRTLTALAIGAVALSSVAAGAADEAPEYQLVDIAGDANFLNGQGFEPGVQQSTSPLSMPGADLQGIRFETLRNGNIVDGLVVHVKLDQSASTPGPELVIRTVASINGCPTMISANTGAITGVTGYLRLTDAALCGNPAEDYDVALGTANYTEGVIVEATDDGFSVTLSFEAGLPAWAKGWLKEGAKITDVDAHVRTFLGAPGVGGATVPVVDELLDPDFTSFKIGDDA